MSSVQRLFADMTAVVEDLHGVTVDGQRRDNSPDMLKALAGHARDHLTVIEALADSIQLRLERSA